MTPDIKTLDEVIEHKQFFIHTIAKWYPDLDRDTIDIFISEILYNIIEKDLITPDTNIRQYVIKALIYHVRREYKNRRVRVRPYNKSPVVPIYHNDMLVHDTTCQGNEYIYNTLRESIYALSEIERNALLLKYMFKMTHPEISKFLGIPIGTSKNRVFSAVHHLRKTLIKQHTT